MSTNKSKFLERMYIHPSKQEVSTYELNDNLSTWTAILSQGCPAMYEYVTMILGYKGTEMASLCMSGS